MDTSCFWDGPIAETPVDEVKVEKRFLASEVTSNEPIDQEKRVLPEFGRADSKRFIDLIHAEQTLPVSIDLLQVERTLPAVRC